MSLINRKGAKDLRAEVLANKKSDRATQLEKDIVKHLNDLHSRDYRTDKEIEKLIIEDELRDLEEMDDDIGLVDGIIMFSPSSASKCERELFFKACRIKKDAVTRYPYQKRWTRNSTAVHRAVQKDLLYAEKILPRPLFRVARTPEGRPAWERNIAHVVPIEHNGVQIQLYGMMDGILEYEDGSTVGLEFKTKSTTIAAVGDYKMKEASPDHRTQCSAYSMLFSKPDGSPIDEYIILYESVAKDEWSKGPDARSDLRPFHIVVSEEDRLRLLDKFARVADAYYNGEIPEPDFSKCMFCPFKVRCSEVEKNANS